MMPAQQLILYQLIQQQGHLNPKGNQHFVQNLPHIHSHFSESISSVSLHMLFNILSVFPKFSTVYYSSTAYKKTLTENVSCFVWICHHHATMAGVNSSPKVVPFFLDYRLLIKRKKTKKLNGTTKDMCSLLTAVCKTFLNVLNDEESSHHTLFCRVTGHFISV